MIRAIVSAFLVAIFAFAARAGIAANSRDVAILAAPEPGTERALNAAMDELCSKQIVLLGENGFHGDGRVVAFRAALIQSLVGKCGFKAVYFESSYYDFLAIDRASRRREAVTPAMVSSAIGGIWNNDTELAPLISFLSQRANDHSLALGGLDDQVGQRGMFYSLGAMPAELAAFLPSSRREQCHQLLEQRLLNQFPADTTREAHAAAVKQCLNEMRIAIKASRQGADADRADYLGMVANFDRSQARDALSDADYNADRDRAMFGNLSWLRARLPDNAKIIIWAANGHVRKDAGDASVSSGPPLGFYVHQAFGRGAYSLGATAGEGSFRYSAKITRPIPAAPPGSIEAVVLSASKDAAIFVSAARLRKFGSVSGGAFDDHQQKVALWSAVYDGLIVFRDERPPFRKAGS